MFVGVYICVRQDFNYVQRKLPLLLFPNRQFAH